MDAFANGFLPKQVAEVTATDVVARTITWRGRGSSHGVAGILSPEGMPPALDGVPSGRA